MVHLEELGWSSFFQEHWGSRREGLTPARVVEDHGETYRVLGESGMLLADIAGQMRFAASGRTDFPAVGDWVAVDPRFAEGRATIHAILPRKTKFSRKIAGSETREQIVAANIDTVFLVTSLNTDLNLRRIERIRRIFAPIQRAPSLTSPGLPRGSGIHRERARITWNQPFKRARAFRQDGHTVRFVGRR